MAQPFERRIEASDRHDAGAAYITEEESAPLTNPSLSRRERLHRMIYSMDTKFPGEKRLRIMPDLNTILPGGNHKKAKNPDPLLEEQRQRNKELDKELLRKMDLFKVFSPPKMPPTNRRLF